MYSRSPRNEMLQIRYNEFLNYINGLLEKLEELVNIRPVNNGISESSYIYEFKIQCLQGSYIYLSSITTQFYMNNLPIEEPLAQTNLCDSVRDKMAELINIGFLNHVRERADLTSQIRVLLTDIKTTVGEAVAKKQIQFDIEYQQKLQTELNNDVVKAPENEILQPVKKSSSPGLFL